MIQNTGNVHHPAVTTAAIAKPVAAPNTKASSFHDLFSFNMASPTTAPKTAPMTPPKPPAAITEPVAVPNTKASSFHDLFSFNMASPTTAAKTAPQEAAVTTATITKRAVVAPHLTASSFHDLFTSPTAPVAKPLSLSDPVFEQGASVINQDGSITPLNSMELAAESTAQEIATKLGGTVVEENWSGIAKSAPVRDIVVPGSSAQINAGIAASLFAMYGDAPGSQAWQIINRDLGKTNV